MAATCAAFLDDAVYNHQQYRTWPLFKMTGLHETVTMYRTTSLSSLQTTAVERKDRDLYL